ncbi:MAG: AccI family restriction endonuclease [Endomicrobium sp.]|jgi:type II restriction enzyme|nr:AccI family restriction endonuclease [Endomicrobium sp.]
MSYYEKIRNLTKSVPVEIINFSKDREPARIPTQASSNFITNKEQGDWAENLIIRAINEKSKNYVAVKYGKSDDLVAGEEGFDEFFQQFQKELDSIGKRPDLLIFCKSDFDEKLGYDISKLNHSQINSYVKKAVAGIEVRSSSFLIDKYDACMQERVNKFTKLSLELKDKIISKYSDLLTAPQRESYLELLKSINEKTLTTIDFRVPSWSANKSLVEVSELFRRLKNAIKEIQKRDYLSITPKVEDIKVVYKWIETFNVPHYYFQVFFDKIYAIAFSDILSVISDANNEDLIFSLEKDIKNQNKTTIKINSKSGIAIAQKVNEPSHSSVRKEMDRGRLLFYVKFNGGTAFLDINALSKLLGIKEEDF